MKLDVSLDAADAGYFLKPLFHGQEIFSLNDEEKHFVITQPVSSTLIKATYGPFAAQAEVPSRLLHASWANRTSTLNNIIVDNLDISAHLVTRTMMQDRPLLQVLFHASPLLESRRTGSEVMNLNLSAQERVGSVSPSHGTMASKFCLQMHVQKAGQELTSVCVLSAAVNVCIAELTLPSDWWVDGQTESVDVLYSVYGIHQNLQCSSASSGSVPGSEPNVLERVKSFVSTVTLTHGQMTYQELKEDQHILIYIPQKSFYSGSKFRVPVKLQAESDLQLFGIKVKSRHGVRVIGAEAYDETTWRIKKEISHKQHTGMVTAFVHNRDKYSKTDRIQDIFELIFEVEAGATGENPGRVAMTLEYEVTSPSDGTTSVVENRVNTRVEIQHDNTYTIVPVIKTTEIINTAILTGSIQNFVMRVYSISQTGKIGDITSHTTCHSGDEEVLKVAESCQLVYVDGSEARGSQSVSVIAKYGRHTRFLFFRVWVPEVPLEVELSDYKLSNVKGWKAPPRNTGASRNPRGVDYGILTHPGLLLQEDGQPREGKEDYSATCRLRYQTALVEVYARFTVPDGDEHSLYLVHRKALFRVTSLVRSRLRVADESIAAMSNGGRTVDGLRDGRTEVQVMSRYGRPIGAKELKVGNDKVSLDKLQVDVVAGLDLAVAEESEMPGTLVTRIDTKTQLTKNYQEAVLAVSLRFSDGTSLPLEYVPSTDYFLDMDTLNNHVVAFGPMLTSSTPRVIALGQGKGELLKVALELGDTCQRKRSRPLDVSYVYIDVDFTAEEDGTEVLAPTGNGLIGEEKVGKNGEKLQKDASHIGYGYDQGANHPESELYLNVDKGDRAEQDKVKEEDKDGIVGSHMEVDLGQIPSSEAQQQHVLEGQPLTPLEIGMYVLLGVFCLAIVVFMVNCMVFVVKYRRKRLPREGRDPVANANDWVWIGRATLERNAINTGCQQALMPDSDFNGNHSMNNTASRFLTTQHSSPADPSNPSSNRSSAAISEQSHGLSTLSRAASNPTTAAPNRNSMVSTYKGSECSIRITANPLPENGPAPPQAPTSPALAGPASPVPTPSSASSLPRPLPRLSAPPCGTIPRIQPPKALPLRASLPTPEQQAFLAQAAAHAAEQNARELDAANGNLLVDHGAAGAVGGGSSGAGSMAGSLMDVEWDYEAMGLTYEQLMEYFDNLKESTA